MTQDNWQERRLAEENEVAKVPKLCSKEIIVSFQNSTKKWKNWTKGQS